jgi:excisionase family DNA binding protein
MRYVATTKPNEQKMQKVRQTQEVAGLNVARAAKYVGTSGPTLLKILKSGEIPHRRVGRRVFIARAALDKWLEGEDKK